MTKDAVRPSCVGVTEIANFAKYAAANVPSADTARYSSYMSETAYSQRMPRQREGLEQSVLDALVTTGLADPEAPIATVHTIDIEHAYPIPTRDRDAAVDGFVQGDMPLFLLSLRAGGTGLNLAAADVVIHLDPWWNPAVEDQATDRAHRIGQSRTVSVYRIVAAGTIEEAILRMKQRKRALASAFVEDDDAPAVKRLRAEDVEELLRFDA